MKKLACVFGKWCHHGWGSADLVKASMETLLCFWTEHFRHYYSMAIECVRRIRTKQSCSPAAVSTEPSHENVFPASTPIRWIGRLGTVTRKIVKKMNRVVIEGVRNIQLLSPRNFWCNQLVCSMCRTFIGSTLRLQVERIDATAEISSATL